MRLEKMLESILSLGGIAGVLRSSSPEQSVPAILHMVRNKFRRSWLLDDYNHRVLLWSWRQ